LCPIIASLKAYFLGLIQLERGFRGGKIEVMVVILRAAARVNKRKLRG
jgi:hypothetical protein